ncbi:hypothetical protein ACIPMZ_15900 [Scandinavium goeteborgense]|jgi:hypothetical protein|uniref:hypothetical protein n=1 Tax=Scandinavium goeteborgense TaxID=1851514 RepID=UPI000D7C7D04|nr:hypothetical protein [Scandinavium goeteborgense]MCS2152424.1 hypothetical protein [Scandinavium goeteborgense]
MFDSKMADLRQGRWKKRLPMLVAKGARSGNPYDYYAVHLVDVDRNRYQLVGYKHRAVTLARWDYDEGRYLDERRISVAELDAMQAEIIHHRSYGPVSFPGILGFSFSYRTRFAYLKTLFSRGKGKLVSTFFANKELKSRDRIALLNLLVNEYIQQRPSRLHAGVLIDEVIEMLYGKLWYKHIRNEEFRRKVRLLLKSLIITGDLAQKDERYYVQPQSVATIVEFEKEERRVEQQDKMQRNFVRLMIVITASTALITLALLGLAGVIDLHKVWETLSNLNPFSILMKLI